MNQDEFEGKWKQLKGKIREKWGDLTDDEIDQIGGHKDQLIGKIQERYGYAKDQAEHQVEAYLHDDDVTSLFGNDAEERLFGDDSTKFGKA
jgi:uncharacterized protein YjbJ (UPF0337 family)